VKRQDEISMNHIEDTQPLRDNFAAKFTGYFQAKNTGLYSFCTESGDGSVMYLDTVNKASNWPVANLKPIINNGGTHSARLECSG
jgi:hypothetical protein